MKESVQDYASVSASPIASQTEPSVTQHLMVPKPKHAKVFVLQPSGSFGIVRQLLFFTMLPAVYFHNQASLETDKIYNIRSERLLPAKLMSAELARAEHAP